MSRELLSIRYANTSNRTIAHYPVTYGVPLPESVLIPGRELALKTAKGALLPVQVKSLETWPDGSIKWLLLDFELPLTPNEEGQLILVADAHPPATSDLSVTETPERITVTTNRLRAVFSKTEFALFASYQVNAGEILLPGSDIVVEDLNGKRYYASLARTLQVRLAEQGPLRTVIEVTGRHTAEDDSEMLSFRVRYTFRPNEPGVAIAYKFTNRETPETGVKLAAIQIVVPTVLGARTTKHIRQTAHGANWFSRLVAVRENVELIAGKPLNDAAKTRYGAFAEGKILIRNLDSLKENLAEYPYYLRPGNVRTDMTGGIRQTYPYLGMNGANGSVLGWFFEMENNYPKAIRGNRNTLTFDVWPAAAGDCHVRRGQSKEHELFLSCDAAPRAPEALEAIYFDHEIVGMGVLGASARPLALTLDPDYVRECKVLQLQRWLKYDDKRYTAIEVKLGSAGAKGSLPNKGLWDYGDSVTPDRSWCQNNENDAILDQLRDYYRRAEPSMLAAALARARHNAHVDFIAFDPDPLRHGAMPAHCPEHTDGATYPSHMWVDGLMAAYTVSGEPDFLDAALTVGENMLRWQQQNPTIFYADSRECGWPMLAFLRLHEYTRDPRWLAACREVFEFYRARVGEDGQITYELPHGVGTVVGGYGEFIGWRSLFFYWERTGDAAVREFLVRCLDKVYQRRPGPLAGWACNDLFPAWAAYTLTDADKYIEDNYPFLKFLMERDGNFPWGGVDLHFYLAELDRRGTLSRFA
jgi:hypothetical protein